MCVWQQGKRQLCEPVPEGSVSIHICVQEHGMSEYTWQGGRVDYEWSVNR